MKFLLVLVAVFAVSYSRKIDVNELVNKIQAISKKDDASSEELEDLMKDGLKDLTAQVELAVCKSNGTKLYDATLKTIDCAKNAKTDGIICDTVHDQFRKCIEPIEKVFEGCLEAKFHDIPQLLINSLTSTGEWLCNSKVRDIVELSNPCAAVDVENIKKCVDGIEKKLKNLDAVTNLKTELCGEMTKQKDCILSEVNKNCKNELTKKSFSDLYEAAIVKPCAA